MVESGDTSPEVVESLYYSWTRQGGIRTRTGPLRRMVRYESQCRADSTGLARVNGILGNYDLALHHLEEILTFADVGTAARYEKAFFLEQIGRRDESAEIYTDLIERFLDGIIPVQRRVDVRCPRTMGDGTVS